MMDCVSVEDFLREVQEDWKSPTTSSFCDKMPLCRNTMQSIEENGENGGHTMSFSSFMPIAANEPMKISLHVFLGPLEPFLLVSIG
uniref:Uncharacterized protein n=1 Tax=Periophthalmus magnuspinnatus TaxID=409849 RepID=A0A3B4B4L6_9GOBI